MSQGNVMLRCQVMVLLTCGEKEKKSGILHNMAQKSDAEDFLKALNS